MRRLSSLLIYAALVLVALAILMPVLWMVSVSFMPSGSANTYPPPWIPRHPTLVHYRELFTRLEIGRHLINSAIVSVSAAVLSVLVTSMAGYALAKLRFRGRQYLTGLLVAGMVVPAQVAMLPLFLLVKWFGLVNTFGGAIIPLAAPIFGIFLVRQYALSIPDALLDAARVDGASEFRIYRSIVLPAIRPVLITLAIFTFVAAWNDFMWPLIVLNDESRYTLPVALATLSGEHAQDAELMMAGAVLTVLPVLAVFFPLQRYYVQGILAGSVKG